MFWLLRVDLRVGEVVPNLRLYIQDVQVTHVVRGLMLFFGGAAYGTSAFELDVAHMARRGRCVSRTWSAILSWTCGCSLVGVSALVSVISWLLR